MGPGQEKDRNRRPRPDRELRNRFRRNQRFSQQQGLARSSLTLVKIAVHSYAHGSRHEVSLDVPREGRRDQGIRVDPRAEDGRGSARSLHQESVLVE